VRADRPSSTAALIAAATVFLSRSGETRALVPEGAAPWCGRCLEALSPARYRLVEALSRPGLRWLAWAAERATVPGLMRHFMARKRWIEREARVGLAREGAQLVVIGAGFDTLAVRLAAELPGRRFFEIDHPATQAVKRAALAEAGVTLVSADLAHVPLGRVLCAMPGYDASAPTVFVVEGLLMYLVEAQVEALFRAIRGAHRGALRIVFTTMEPAPDGRLAFHNATALTRWLLSRWGEPFRSALPKAAAAGFLARAGFALEAVREPEDPRHAQGEIVMVASGAPA
jgi:methyltransferase (TIGR00027 family)